MFKRLQTTLKGIKRVLLEDEQIRKLLYNDSNNALNLGTPAKESVSKYITTYPIYEFEGRDDYTQQGMINCFISDSEPDDDIKVTDSILRINVVYNTEKWELVDGSCRLLSLCERMIENFDRYSFYTEGRINRDIENNRKGAFIIELVDNKKFSISNPISYNSLTELILSKKLVGYALLFNLTDGNSELENF